MRQNFVRLSGTGSPAVVLTFVLEPNLAPGLVIRHGLSCGARYTYLNLLLSKRDSAYYF